MPRGHRLLRTPHAGGALALLPSASSLRLGHSCKPDGSRLLRRLCGQEPSNAARAEAACGLYLASARNRRRNRMPSCLHGRLRCQEEADRQHAGQRKQRTRRELGAGIAFPATFLSPFLVAQKSKCPAGMRRPEKPVPSRHERAKKNKRPSAIDITIKPTVYYNVLPMSGRSHPGRRPATAQCLLRLRWLRP